MSVPAFNVVGRQGPTDPGSDPPDWDKMEERVRNLEISFARVDVRLDGIGSTLERIEKRLDKIEDKALTEWKVAKVMGAVIGAFGAVALFVLRVTGIITFP